MIEVRELNPSEPSAPIALVIPGLGYTAQAPILYWSSEVLIEAGWNVYTVAWTPPADVLDHARPYVEDALRRAIERIGRRPHLILGKSLGSFALPYSVASDIPGIWLTPILTDSSVAEALCSASDQHLAIGGDADQAWQPKAAGNTQAMLYTAPRMNHSLELVPSDWRATLDAQAALIERVAVHAAKVR